MTTNESKSAGPERTAVNIENGAEHARRHAQAMTKLAALLRNREDLERDIAETRRVVADAGDLLASYYRIDRQGRAL